MGEPAEEGLIQLVTMFLLIVSEMLPFVSRWSGNGLLHTFATVISKIVKTGHTQLKETCQEEDKQK